MITLKTYHELTGQPIPTIRKDLADGLIRYRKIGKLLFLDGCEDILGKVSKPDSEEGTYVMDTVNKIRYYSSYFDFSLPSLLKYRRDFFKHGGIAPPLKYPPFMTLDDYAEKTGRSRTAVVEVLQYTDHFVLEGHTFIRELGEIDYDAVANARSKDNIWKDYRGRPWHPDNKNRLLIRTLARFTDSDLYIFREFYNELYSLM